MGRSTSTITRELARNRRPTGFYAASVAHSYATARRRAVRRGTQFSADQWDAVLHLIQLDYSPEQAAHIIEQYFEFSISHETIYQYLLYDKKKGGSLYKHLRIVPKRRRKRYNSHDSRGRLAGKRMIDERPLEVDYRVSIGHWEGDTVIGKNRKHCIVTLVERKTSYVIIKKIKARTVEQVNQACLAAIAEHADKFKTITFDNGTEFHG
jgi:IS30 family transposase